MITVLVILFIVSILLVLKPTRGPILSVLGSMGVLGAILIWLMVVVCSVGMPVFVVWAIGHYGLHWW